MTATGVETTRVRAALELGRPAEALRLLSPLLASDPDNAALWTLLSEAHHDAEAYPQALEAAVRAVRADPHSGQAQFFLALGVWNTHVLGRNPRWGAARRHARQAQDALRSAIALTPFHPGYRVTLAQLVLQTGGTAEARTLLTRALELHPHSTPALVTLAELALKRRDAPEAERLARQVLALEPQSVPGLGTLAWAQLRQNDPHTALRTALDAVRLAPGDPAARAYFSALSHAYLPRPLARGSWTWRLAMIPQAGIALIPVMAVGLTTRNVWRYRRLPPELRAAVALVRPMRREVGVTVCVLGIVVLGVVGLLDTRLAGPAGLLISVLMLGLVAFLIVGAVRGIRLRRR
ncbi:MULTISPECIES: tetratricopeptide repeat protein [Deinococcus]|uniref:Tetratricopeptide repeat protein n=1 Tax=Deinococcus rufus TaxID=2136097 RepID=A0ABV7Z5X0_9DEIO|nr:tetratricopeptide repeat protein [Deinococcus sp. AB2017081]WQE96451.1 tetratricopeptide repeat protein [Deinococcus sp. AB2017081]